MAEFLENSMPAVFQNRTLLHGDKPCVGYKRGDGVYVDLSWEEMNTMIHQLASYLISLGIKPGDKVALFSPNRFEWWVTDLAVLSIGAVDVPIYATNSSAEAKYVIEHSDSTICLAGTEDHLRRLLDVKKDLPGLKELIVFDEDAARDGARSFAAVLAEGEKKRDDQEFERRLRAIKAETCATIIYTSGTTGNPKGVMLSHDNLFSNARQVHGVAPDLFDSRAHTLLSFLPLSHSFERSVGYYTPIYGSGVQPHKVVFAEDFAKILENFQEVRPSFVVSVPRLYEKIHTGILSKVGMAPPLKQTLFGQAMKTAAKNLPFICNDRKRTGLFALQYALFERLVFGKLKAALGMDQLEFALSGGGPLARSDAEFFLGMGVKVLEGFGLTETTPVTHGNRPWHIKPGTVGAPVNQTEARIAKNGELQIKGPQVMLGYYKNKAATDEVFTADGWFKTGDIGEIDSEGYLKITGRIKDIIVTSGGKNISPQNIENSLKASQFIEQVAIIGDNRKYLSALVVPAFEELEHWAKEEGIDGDHDALLRNDRVQELYKEEIQKHMADFARVEQIRKFKLLTNEWSQETDELTPTLKLKRRVINSKYSSEIEAMYPAN